jgi:dienelactone hydrolase
MNANQRSGTRELLPRYRRLAASDREPPATLPPTRTVSPLACWVAAPLILLAALGCSGSAGDMSDVYSGHAETDEVSSSSPTVQDQPEDTAILVTSGPGGGQAGANETTPTSLAGGAVGAAEPEAVVEQAGDEDPTLGFAGEPDATSMAGSSDGEDSEDPPTDDSEVPLEPESEASDPASGTSDAIMRGATPTLDSASSPGPYMVEMVTSGLRDGPMYSTQTLYVPTDAEPPLAAVAVVPGFVAPESSIEAWGPFLASHGIVAITIGTNTPLDLPDVRADALLDALETVAAENVRSGSPLEGRVDTDRFGVMGWSMGGGGTLIAANTSPQLGAAIGLAAWSPGAQFADDSVPTLLFAGTADTLAGGQSQGFYASIPESTPKMLYEVNGAGHDVANDPAGTTGAIGRFGLSWFKVFLEGDERYQSLLSEPVQASDFQTNL